jgi:hypothetical protein
MTLWEIQDAYIARLQAAAPAGVAVKSTFDDTDWSAEESPTVGAHVVFDGLDPADETGSSAMLRLSFSAHVYLDVQRAGPNDATVAQDTITAALKSAIGWEWRTGLVARLTAGKPTGFDGRIARVSISFAVPAHESGIA